MARTTTRRRGPGNPGRSRLQAVRDPAPADGAPRAVTLNPADFVVRRKPGEDGFTDDDFWEARPELAAVRTYARSMTVSPWAMFGAVLLRVLDRVPPDYVLPKITGSYGSLNLYVALVAPSGVGKNTAWDAAEDAYVFGEDPDGDHDPWPLGTGEGLIKTFVKRAQADDIDPDTAKPAIPGSVIRIRKSAIFTCLEVDEFAALITRRNATLPGTLRDGWNGAWLGKTNGEDERRLKVGRHTYRLGLVVGVQPERAASLLSEEEIKGGTAGRFLWLPAWDPGALDLEDLHASPEPATWVMPPWPADAPFRTGWHELPVCADAVREIRTARIARLRDPGSDDINGHALLARLKVAAALGLLAERVGVTNEDWLLASYVMSVSDRTRDGILTILREAAAEKNRAQGRAEGERALIAQRVQDEDAVRRVCKTLMRRAEKARDADDGPWLNRKALSDAVAGRNKGDFPHALGLLVDSGQLERRDGLEGRRGEWFRAV